MESNLTNSKKKAANKVGKIFVHFDMTIRLPTPSLPRYILTQNTSPFRLIACLFHFGGSMVLKIFSALIVVLVVLVGALLITQQFGYGPTVNLSLARDFFDVSLPILAFGALIKYLCTFRCGYGCKCSCCVKRD